MLKTLGFESVISTSMSRTVVDYDSVDDYSDTTMSRVVQSLSSIVYYLCGVFHRSLRARHCTHRAHSCAQSFNRHIRARGHTSAISTQGTPIDKRSVS
eukprot:SAG31_NODE_16208_length_718_cov_1.675283_1_plen_97_part_10